MLTSKSQKHALLSAHFKTYNKVLKKIILSRDSIMQLGKQLMKF